MRRTMVLLFGASLLVWSPFPGLDQSAWAKTKKQCEATRDGCYRRCNDRYKDADRAGDLPGDAVLRCGVRTCDPQFATCVSQVSQESTPLTIGPSVQEETGSGLKPRVSGEPILPRPSASGDGGR